MNEARKRAMVADLLRAAQELSLPMLAQGLRLAAHRGGVNPERKVRR
jgi:hypothetical protein